MNRALILGILLGTMVVGTTAVVVVRPASAQEATPAAILDVPGPDECRVPPRTPDALVAALGTPAADGTPAVSVASAEGALPTGESLDAATRDAIVATTRQFFACINGGDSFRSLALVTDDFLRRQLGGLAPTQRQLRALEARLAVAAAASPVALDVSNRGALVVVRDARRLPGGRVGALVVIEAPSLDAPPDIAFFVYVETAGQWLIDDVVNVAEEPDATPSS